MTMLGKHHSLETKLAISKAQKIREHQLQEGFRKGHKPFSGTEGTRFKKGNIPWIKGKGTGRDLFKLKYRTYKSNAKQRGYGFEITLDEFKKIISGQCYYCHGFAIGIDRLDSSLGYIKGNMVSCCEMCNRMKNHYSLKDFIAKCKQIVTCVGYEI